MAIKYVLKNAKGEYLQKAKSPYGTIRRSVENIWDATIFHKRNAATNATYYWKNSTVVEIEIRVKER